MTMKFSLCIVSILIFYSCKQTTLIEGRIPIKTVENFNKSFRIIDNNIDLCTLRVDKSYFILALKSTFNKANNSNDYYNYSVNDSVFSTVISTPLPLQQKEKQNSVYRYQFGDMPSDSIKYVANVNLLLAAGIKSPPYTASYRKPSSIDSLNFSPKDNGYIAFNAFDSLNNRIYGWLHVIVDSSAVTFDKYSYQKFEAAKMGDEKN